MVYLKLLQKFLGYNGNFIGNWGDDLETTRYIETLIKFSYKLNHQKKNIQAEKMLTFVPLENN